jgi:hypothetical protein
MKSRKEYSVKENLCVPTDIIGSIDVDKMETWHDKVFLTIDIDWAHDEILEDTIQLVEETGVCATWFITHETSDLEFLRGNPRFELGIHPNFNPLLLGDKSLGKSADEVVSRLLEIVPEAKSVRSHSMAQSSVLLNLFSEKGLTHDCNHYIPQQSQIVLKPWHLWNGLIRVPYFWEDDLSCIYEDTFDASSLLSRQGLRVFDFHPIHLFLNTNNLEQYEETRSFHQNPNELIKYRSESIPGARTRFVELFSSLASVYS